MGVGITTAEVNKHFATPREYFVLCGVNKQSIVPCDRSAEMCTLGRTSIVASLLFVRRRQQSREREKR